jgi:hypothetical protein
METLEFPADERPELRALRAAAKERGWWTRYSFLSDNLVRLYGMEHGAETIRYYAALVIPGLLQCDAYIRAITESNIFVARADVEQAIDVRKRRQERLFSDDPLRLITVVNEGALHQNVGGPQVRLAQLKHLMALLDDHKEIIDLRVIPFESTSDRVIGSASFHLLNFSSPQLPQLCWQDSQGVLGFLTDEHVIRDMGVIFHQAHTGALSRDDSHALIEGLASRLR